MTVSVGGLQQGTAAAGGRSTVKRSRLRHARCVFSDDFRARRSDFSGAPTATLYSRSNTAAIPWPPPMHIVTSA